MGTGMHGLLLGTNADDFSGWLVSVEHRYRNANFPQPFGAAFGLNRVTCQIFCGTGLEQM